MKKQTLTKIISKVLIFAFILPVFSFASPVFALTGPTYSGPTYNGASLYSNPNTTTNNNAYKFKVSDVVNSNMLTQVVGCTGIVTKVSTWMAKFVASPGRQLKMAKATIKKIRAQLKSACSSVKAGTEATAGATPTVNDLVSSIKTIFAKINIKIGTEEIEPCKDQVDATSDEMIQFAKEAADAVEAKNLREECFNGIAITLAKNQLTAMTRSAMNWVNSGLGGNPFFVQNMKNLTYNLEKNVIETGIDVLLAPDTANPYAADFSRSTINQKGIVASSSKFLGGLQSDLSNFITSPESWYTNDQLDKADMTQTALQNARDANNSFANDFSLGGWEGWLALTQREKNNPLGYNMTATQYLSDIQEQVVSDTKAEVSQNNGFMSQKDCIEWQIYDEKGKPKRKDSDKNLKQVINPLKADGTMKTAFELKAEQRPQLAKITEFVFSKSKPGPVKPDDGYGECVDWKITTPGSLIRDKVTGYLNSPERQLEIAKTINDSLNALFSVLITKLQGSGLSSLSDSAVSTNWTDNMNSLSLSGDSSPTYDNNGAYDNFNLTRDLGNTYIHDTVYDFGQWNAKENKTTSINGINDNKTLYPNMNPELYSTSTVDGTETSIISNSAYYTVNQPGQSKIMTEGYNVWEVGDRAYWDGTKWQNWKCSPKEVVDPITKKVSIVCTKQQSPIKNRGVIQIQNDYIVAAKQILEVLPNVLAKIGELDYCLPGPNPNYKTNSGSAQSAYQDWVSSATVGSIDSTNERFGVKIDKIGARTYNTLKDIYKDNVNVWNAVLASMQGWIHEFSVLCDRGESGPDCTSSYFYAKNGNMNRYQAQHYAAKSDLKEITLNYVNNTQFPNFYKVFDATMNKLYFKNVINKYLETEDSSKLTPNPAYIPMSEEGYDLIKDILSYSDDIADRIKEYNDATTQAKINISKLEPIKLEVSGIIKAAQDRRKINLDKIISAPNEIPIKECEAVQNDCLEGFASGQTVPKNGNTHDICLREYDNCITDKTKSGEILSDTKLQEAYKTCLLEEDIQFYDAEGIMAMGSADAERCSDGIDNDLNGIIDCKDPACEEDPYCKGVNVPNYKCIAVNDYSVNSYYSDGACADGKCFGVLKDNKYSSNPCEMRATQADCAAKNYKYGNSSFHQNFLDPYRTYKVKSCLWADVVPVQGQCIITPSTTREVHSYMSDLNCTDDKCRGVLAAGFYSPSSCKVRGPGDCAATESIVSGPTRVRNGFLGLDPYNKYTVNKCNWQN